MKSCLDSLHHFHSFCCAAFSLAVGQAAAPVGANDKGLTLASKTKRLGKTVVYLKGESRTARCIS